MQAQSAPRTASDRLTPGRCTLISLISPIDTSFGGVSKATWAMRSSVTLSPSISTRATLPAAPAPALRTRDLGRQSKLFEDSDRVPFLKSTFGGDQSHHSLAAGASPARRRARSPRPQRTRPSSFGFRASAFGLDTRLPRARKPCPGFGAIHPAPCLPTHHALSKPLRPRIVIPACIGGGDPAASMLSPSPTAVRYSLRPRQLAGLGSGQAGPLATAEQLPFSRRRLSTATRRWTGEFDPPDPAPRFGHALSEQPRSQNNLAGRRLGDFVEVGAGDTAKKPSALIACPWPF